MIFTNLAGTTSNLFKVGIGGNGQILSNNAYDFYWKSSNPNYSSENSSVIRLSPNQDILNVGIGQYYYIDSSPVRNGPVGVNEQFTMLVEPSNGYFPMEKRYTIRYCNGAGIYVYDDTKSSYGWLRLSYSNDIHHETGNWFPTVSSGYTMSNLGNNTFTRWGRFCYLNAYFILTKTAVSGADLSIGGVPFPIFYGQMNGNILIADEYVKSINDSDETITTIVPDFPIPSPASSNTFGIIAQTYTTASSNSASNMILSDFMRLNVNLHIRMSLIYTVVV